MAIDPNNPGQVMDAYNTIMGSLSDTNIDETTRNELATGMGQLDSLKGQWGDNLGFLGSTLTNLNDKLMQARAGTGIYGVRKLNENQKNMISAQPGRSQLAAAKFGSSGGATANQNQGGLGASSSLGSFF